jgi:hypothetical protein
MLLLAALPARAEDSPPPLALRRSVFPVGPVWIGQRVSVTLTAMTPLRFAAPPEFPALAVEGRAILLPETSTLPGVERQAGASLVAVQHVETLFPAEAGVLLLPPLRMTARVGSADGQPLEGEAMVPAERIEVRIPPGVTDLTRLVVAPDFRITTSLDRPPEGLRAGEAILRMVRLEARDTAAMLLPPTPWEAPAGMAVYPDPPVLEDRLDRGTLRASRLDRAAFVPQRAGSFDLPGFSVTWFDPASGRLREELVAPIRIEALPALGPGTASAGAAWWPRAGAAALALVVLALGLLAWHGRQRGRRDPAQAAFVALLRACHAHDAPAALRALFRWRDAEMPAAEGDGGIAALAARARTPALLTEALALQERLYAASAAEEGWHGGALAAAARKARRSLRRPALAAHRAGLPPLNPALGPRQPPRVALRGWAR